MSLLTRIIAGSTVFLILAAVDLRQNGRAARRWREYLFLIFCVAAAMIYGALNDQITSRISWEYFYFGKELYKSLGPQVPPDPAALHWQAAKVGMQASWSAGLIAGALLLMANNAGPRRRPLSFTRLAGYLPFIAAIAIACGVLAGAAGYFGKLNWISQDFILLQQTGLWRPRRFMTTYGIHLGGYIGSAVGLILAVVVVRKRSSNSPASPTASTPSIASPAPPAVTSR